MALFSRAFNPAASGREATVSALVSGTGLQAG
jgi:hypothetical protein